MSVLKRWGVGKTPTSLFEIDKSGFLKVEAW